MAQIDFSPIGELFNTYQTARKQRMRDDALSTLGSGSGELDFNEAGRALLRSGDTSGLALLKLGLDQKKQADELKASQEFGNSMRGLFGPQSNAAPTSAVPTNYGGAIASIESGGQPEPYRALGPVTRDGDRAYGKYQVMGKNVGPWTKEILGREMTPQEFLADDKAQDAVVEAKMSSYAQKYGPEGAGRAWFAGEGGMNDPGRKDMLGTTVAAYGNKFSTAMGRTPGIETGPRSELGRHAPTQVAQAPAVVDPSAGATIAGAPPSKIIPALIASANNPRLPKQSQELAKTMLEHALKQSDLPPDVKEYLFAKGQGYAKPYAEWKAEADERKAAKTQVNIDQKGETKYDEHTSKHFAELNTKIIEGAQNARGKVAMLSRLGQLLADPNIYTGAGAGLVLEAKRVAKAVGIDVGDLGGAEAVRSISNQFALELRNPSGGAGMPGAMSDQDRNFLTQIPPGLEKTPEGNAILLDYQKRIAKRSIEVDALRRDYIKRNKRLGEDFYQELAEWSEKNPLFPEAKTMPTPRPTNAPGGTTKGGLKWSVQ